MIAAELGWPLYRVDLGQLVSKYVGETEKNLNRLFDAAHGRPMVLQFDEADSLFGKRGEIKEARDRYANLEVNHLLARIEAHRGPCILTTNLRKNLDPAFARRFQVVVDFPRPDAESRTRLWSRLLPPRRPARRRGRSRLPGPRGQPDRRRHPQRRPPRRLLGRRRGSPITLAHVTLAVWRELGKDGRELSRGDLGALAPYFGMRLPESPMWSIERLRLDLPPGFEHRAPDIATRLARELESLPFREISGWRR